MYPNTFYRVSVKAFITNDDNQVFVVKESENFWALPGGGLDHGETPQECLKREIFEELGVKDLEVGDIACTKSFYLDRMDAWMIWIVYKAKLNAADFIFGDGVTDVKFIDAKEFENNTDMFERAIFEISNSIS